MILKVEDALKLLRRTDPDSEAGRDLKELYFPPLAARFISNKKILELLISFCY